MIDQEKARNEHAKLTKSHVCCKMFAADFVYDSDQEIDEHQKQSCGLDQVVYGTYDGSDFRIICVFEQVISDNGVSDISNQIHTKYCVEHTFNHVNYPLSNS